MGRWEEAHFAAGTRQGEGERKAQRLRLRALSLVLRDSKESDTRPHEVQKRISVQFSSAVSGRLIIGQIKSKMRLFMRMPLSSSPSPSQVHSLLASGRASPIKKQTLSLPPRYSPIFSHTKSRYSGLAIPLAWPRPSQTYRYENHQPIR